MKFIDTMKRLALKAAGSATFRGFNSSSSTINTAEQVDKFYAGTAFSCVNAISEELATFHPIVRTKQAGSPDYEVNEDHPILELLKNPNDKQGAYEFFYGTGIYYNLTGNAYWLMDTEVGSDVLTPPKSLTLLPSHQVNVELSQAGNPVYKFDSGKGQRQDYSYGQIVHFKKFNPSNQLIGKSPIDALADVLQSDAEAMEYHLSVFRNKAVMGGIINSKDKLNPESEQKLKDNLKQYTGSANAGGTMLLTGTDFTFQPTTSSAADLQLIQVLKYNQERIMAHYRVSGAILGIQASSNRATAEANRFIFQSQVIKPMMRMLADTISNKLLSRYTTPAGTIVKLDFADPVIPNEAFQLQTLVAGVDRWITPNEAREAQGYERLAEGGDDLLRPANVFPIEDVASGFSGLDGGVPDANGETETTEPTQ